MSSIGEYLALKRTQKRMTQQEVSDALKDRGIIRSASTVANWEAGRQTIGIEIYESLAEILSVDLLEMYEVAGMLKNLPGADIFKVVNRMSESDRERIRRIVFAYDSGNKS